MMNKIPCEIIRDLFPSYIDGLTSETTDLYITDHVSECPDCRNVLESMKSPETDIQPEVMEEKKEIDFLKKNRRRNKWIVWGCIIAVICILAVLFVTRYMIGENKSDLIGDFFMWDVQVEENRLLLDGTVADDIYKVIGFDCSEIEDGVLDISTRVVPSGMVARILYGKAFHFDYTASESIRQVVVNGRILYNENEPISPKTSGIYFTRHLYVGDMPANFRTASFVNVANFLGPYENELQTAEPPYGWTFRLFADIPAERQELRESDMQAFACVLMAVIDNLDVVTFDYTVNGKAASKSFTSSQASDFFGQDIKNCYEDVGLLEELIAKTGLDSYVFGSFPADSATVGMNFPPLYISMVFDTPEDVRGIGMNVYVDGVLITSQGAENADDSPFERGQLIQFFLERGDFQDKYQNDAVVTLTFDIELADGTVIEVPQQLRLPDFGRNLHDLHLAGNSEEGFCIGQ